MDLLLILSLFATFVRPGSLLLVVALVLTCLFVRSSALACTLALHLMLIIKISIPIQLPSLYSTPPYPLCLKHQFLHSL